MELIHSLSGMLEAELTSADIGSSLMAISKLGVEILCVSQKSDLSARIRIFRKDYEKVKGICENRGDSLRKLSHLGLYWKIKTAANRPVLLTGLVICLIFALFLPSKVLFVEVEGNEQLPKRMILEAAESCGIGFGASRRAIRSERVKNALLQKLPQLQWAGVNTYGCVAVISVRERTLPEEKPLQPRFGNVVAVREGIITDCTATRGNLLCQPGQAVVTGQILISGYIDCGLKLVAAGAEGEIYGNTVRKLDAVIPAVYEAKVKADGEDRVYSLLLGKKRINLWKDSGIWDSTCGRIYEENYITLPGGFQLPLGWSVDTLIFGSVETTAYPEETLTVLLTAAGDTYIRQQMIAGKIADQRVSVEFDADCCRLAGEYVCNELIGKWQAEKIGETNGKSD